MVKRPQDDQTEGRRQAHRPTMSAAPRFHRHEKDARRDTPPGVSVSAPPPEGAAVRKSVILSEGRSPKSKDLRTRKRLCRWQVRRSFGSLCSLRMTGGWFLRNGRCPFPTGEKSFLVNHPSHQPPSSPDVCRYALAFSTKHTNCTCVFIRNSPVKPQFS